MRRIIVCLIFAVAILSAAHSTILGSNRPNTELPCRLHDGYLVIVSGSVGEHQDLRFLIETGATFSVIDQRWVGKLGLQTLPQKVPIRSAGRDSTLRQVILPELKLGPLTCRSFPVLVSDLSFVGTYVDIIIGLDILRHKSFTIDYKKKKLIFGTEELQGSAVPFRSMFPALVVEVEIEGKPVQLMVDSGCEDLMLFKERVRGRIKPARVLSRGRIQHLRGQAAVTRVLFSRLQMGQKDWVGEAFLLEGNHPHVDGILGLSSLGVDRVCFDFQSGMLSFF
jgi:predicted aspartyl protease